jgi:hypothetical protein
MDRKKKANRSLCWMAIKRGNSREAKSFEVLSEFEMCARECG